MKKYIQPQVIIDDIEDDLMKHDASHKPGLGPDKDSDGDGYHMPPGQDPNSLDNEFINECFEVL